MTKTEWINKVSENKDVLKEFIRGYHPANLRPRSNKEQVAANITAPQAERACERVRELIRKESLEYPEVQFHIALQKQDCQTIYSLLSSTWFGVPESTSCWQIPGFSVAVNLMDDPIEWDELEENP